MNAEPIAFKKYTPFEEALLVFNGHHSVNPIPVVDDLNYLIGIVSRHDILKPFDYLPSSVKLP